MPNTYNAIFLSKADGTAEEYGNSGNAGGGGGGISIEKLPDDITDLNDVIVTSMYAVPAAKMSTISNKPDGAVNNNSLLTTFYIDGDYTGNTGSYTVQQELQVYGGTDNTIGCFWRRSKDVGNAGWSTWRKYTADSPFSVVNGKVCITYDDGR